MKTLKNNQPLITKLATIQINITIDLLCQLEHQLHHNQYTQLGGLDNSTLFERLIPLLSAIKTFVNQTTHQTNT